MRQGAVYPAEGIHVLLMSAARARAGTVELRVLGGHGRDRWCGPHVLSRSVARNGFCACGAILSAAVISAVAPGLAQGASPGPETTGSLEPTVSFLQSAQRTARGALRGPPSGGIPRTLSTSARGVAPRARPPLRCTPRIPDPRRITGWSERLLYLSEHAERTGTRPSWRERCSLFGPQPAASPAIRESQPRPTTARSQTARRVLPAAFRQVEGQRHRHGVRGSRAEPDTRRSGRAGSRKSDPNGSSKSRTWTGAGPPAVVEIASLCGLRR